MAIYTVFVHNVYIPNKYQSIVCKTVQLTTDLTTYVSNVPTVNSVYAGVSKTCY